MKILILDTYYPEVLKSLPFDPRGSYEVQLAAVLDQQFGTADFVSRNLRAIGWNAVDLIANHEGLNKLWNNENGYPGASAIYYQMDSFEPDVLFLQDLSLNFLCKKRPAVVAAQLSCPWPGDDRVRQCDVIATSFPHYVPRIEALGVKAVYLPLAFEPSVLEGPQPERDIDISFVGGVGRDLHWRQGTDVLEAVAAAFPDRFHWYGYGLDRLSPSSPLRACYKGEAWGRKMYEIYRRSKIVINRHGEVAEGFANNMRMYEATGCGAILMNDRCKNQTAFFETYEACWYMDPEDAVIALRHMLAEWSTWKRMGERGQKRTLNCHTYAIRMKTISGVLQEMLCPA